MTMKLTTRAVHEAGHVIAGMTFGMRFDFVTIEQQRESGRLLSNGRVQGFAQSVPDYASAPETKNDPRSLMFWQDMLTVVLAGPAAHKKRHPRANFLTYAVSDLEEACRLIRDIHGHNDREVYFVIEARAAELIERQWSKVEALAAVLVERRTLTFAEVESELSNQAKEEARPSTCPRCCAATMPINRPAARTEQTNPLPATEHQRSQR